MKYIGHFANLMRGQSKKVDIFRKKGNGLWKVRTREWNMRRKGM